ncbi:CLUMA_CG009841, isoform A [Clunio marinus]|uniref:CLUMA_CG009841, isoform A n=1 Tax=Clunio marinus TaxID=568069 RepID=A0A1J1IDA6_9DIPT|nr:CLUMA_CG009841, isoform A [Clunio marinus]
MGVKHTRTQSSQGMQINDVFCIHSPTHHKKKCKPTISHYQIISFKLLVVVFDINTKQQNAGNVDECELRVLIHQSLAGCVIGKGGSKIKELKDVSIKIKLS